MNYAELQKMLFCIPEGIKSTSVAKDIFTYDLCVGKQDEQLDLIQGQLPTLLRWKDNHGLLKPKIMLEEWRDDGELHRLGGPARVEYHNWGTTGLYIIEYLKHGILDRADGPAYLEITATGNLVRAEYYENGLLHRKDGPARISYDYIQAQKHRIGEIPEEELEITFLEYYEQGVMHRKDGPAKQDRRRKGVWGSEQYFLDGVNYNPDGPSHIIRDTFFDGPSLIEIYTNAAGERIKRSEAPTV